LALTGYALNRIFLALEAHFVPYGKGSACIDIVSHGEQTRCTCGNLLIATRGTDLTHIVVKKRVRFLHGQYVWMSDFAQTPLAIRDAITTMRIKLFKRR
jgi:hypothetical protein